MGTQKYYYFFNSKAAIPQPGEQKLLIQRECSQCHICFLSHRPLGGSGDGASPPSLLVWTRFHSLPLSVKEAPQAGSDLLRPAPEELGRGGDPAAKSQDKRPAAREIGPLSRAPPRRSPGTAATRNAPATPAQPFTCAGVSPRPVCGAVAAVQDDIVEHVEEEPDNSSTENQQRRLCLLRVDVPFDRFHQDAEHQGHGKDGVAEGPHDVRPREAEGAPAVPRDVAGPEAEQAYDHGKEVGEDGESVRGQGQGVADVGDHQLHDEEEDAHHAHEDQAEGPARVSAHGAGLPGKAGRAGEPLRIR